MVFIMYHLDELLSKFLKDHPDIDGIAFADEWKQSTKETRKKKHAKKSDDYTTLMRELENFTEIIGKKYRANNFSMVPIRLASLQCGRHVPQWDVAIFRGYIS
jgi:hypothetical protein